MVDNSNDYLYSMFAKDTASFVTEIATWLWDRSTIGKDEGQVSKKKENSREGRSKSNVFVSMIELLPCHCFMKHVTRMPMKREGDKSLG